MKQHQILAERFHESHPDEWAGAKPRLPASRERAMRMSDEQIRSWASQYRKGEIFAEWSLMHNDNADLADRIRERWTLWYVCAFYMQEEIGMLWSWTDPEKGHTARDPFTDATVYRGVIVMHPDDVQRVRDELLASVRRQKEG